MGISSEFMMLIVIVLAIISTGLAYYFGHNFVAAVAAGVGVTVCAVAFVIRRSSA